MVGLVSPPPFSGGLKANWFYFIFLVANIYACVQRQFSERDKQKQQRTEEIWFIIAAGRAVESSLAKAHGTQAHGPRKHEQGWCVLFYVVGVQLDSAWRRHFPARRH
jgi:hypothetical protein